MGGGVGAVPVLWGFSHVKIGGLGSSLKKKKKKNSGSEKCITSGQP